MPLWLSPGRPAFLAASSKLLPFMSVLFSSSFGSSTPAMARLVDESQQPLVPIPTLDTQGARQPKGKGSGLKANLFRVLKEIAFEYFNHISGSVCNADAVLPCS